MRNLLLVVAVAAALIIRATTPHDSTPAPTVESKVATTSEANGLIQRQPGFFVPNLGQWDHAARFVHRSGPMTLFLQDRGWLIDIVEHPINPKTEPHAVHQAIPDDRDVNQKIRGVALRMTFEGDAHVPDIVGKKKLAGHHNYFLGNDESRWRTDVPLYSTVRYENLYPSIDLRLREKNGVPEYDLLLQPGADLSAVKVHVEGGQGLSITSDGSLVIETELGPLTQSVPKTWQVGRDGKKREVVCNFTLLGASRFGFVAPGWDGDTSLTIDPGLIWSTFLGGNGFEAAMALSVDASGIVTVAGLTNSFNFPTTSGAYDASYNSNRDVFVSRLIPAPLGRVGLLYSTYLGGSNFDLGLALSVDASGVVTVAGSTGSSNFPTTGGAFDTTLSGTSGGFVSRLDPSKTGAAQLVYSTFLGGSTFDIVWDLSTDAVGLITVAGETWSSNFPTTSGAYDTTFNAINPPDTDGFVSRLDPSKTGAAQLVYSTFLGGIAIDKPTALSVDAAGVVTVAGSTLSKDYPTTSGAYDKQYGGGYWKAFVSRLDPRKTGTAQLVYSTYLGGSYINEARAVSADARGVVTVAGRTYSTDFPTTRGAFDTTFGGLTDVFVSQLDPSRSGTAQLVYSTFLGGKGNESSAAIVVDTRGVVTVAGYTESDNYPTTSGAFDTTHNGPNLYVGDAFVSRLDPRKTGSAQLVYSTFLGGSSGDNAVALSVDDSGVAMVAGLTSSAGFPTTSRAYDTTHNGGNDTFVSRLDMGVALYGDVHEISIKTGGTQRLTVNAGKPHANRLYWIFGSITGTKPGVNLLGVHIPLNADLYTNVAMGAVNTTVFTKFRGTLDANGLATASFNVPANLPLPSGFTFHHAYVVYDASGKFYMASNAVPLTLR